ncbi:MAG TPA: ASPIC/UnbV domain-containing protein, partial [Chthoniobacterales bacterium]
GTFIDYNNDGFLDLFVCNGAGPDAGPYLLFKNNGNLNHWLKMELTGTKSNRDGVGARITLKAGTTTLYRQYAGQHCMAQNRIPVHFGFRGATTVKSIVIEWPSGVRQQLSNIPADQTIAVRRALSAKRSGYESPILISDELLHKGGGTREDPLKAPPKISYSASEGDRVQADQSAILRFFYAICDMYRRNPTRSRGFAAVATRGCA